MDYLTDKEIQQFKEAVAYARANPIDVRPEDVEKIKIMIYKKVHPLHGFINLSWQPQEHTEYKLEGVKLLIKDILQVRHGDKWYDLPNQKSGRELEGIYQTVQVACLIEDDKQ